MELILILFICITIGVCIYKNYTAKPSKEYPPYYKDVWIYYCLPGEKSERIKLAWLSINDNEEYIWTRSDNEQIIPDAWVIKWEYVK